MILLIAIIVSVLAFGGFFLLTVFEYKHNARILGDARDALDERVTRLVAIWRRVDVLALIAHLIGIGFTRLVHDVVHGTLVIVRGIERLLTHTVHAVRSHHESTKNGNSYAARALHHVKHAFRYKKVDVKDKKGD